MRVSQQELKRFLWDRQWELMEAEGQEADGLEVKVGGLRCPVDFTAATQTSLP